MFLTPFARSARKQRAQALYGKVVLRARAPQFYRDFGVPDTLDGRFEMLVLHLFALHYRLKTENAEARAVSQHVFDAFIKDMDIAMREVGVGDQVVPKRLKKMARVFYGRTGAFEAALDAEDPPSELAIVLGRNINPDHPAPQEGLALYMLAEIKALGETDVKDILDNANIYQGVMA